MARLRTIAPHRARRIALGAQGFADRRPAGAPDVRHFRRVLDRMAILQLDSVNVLCRSHFMPVYARLGPYDRDKLDQWLWRSGENHEYLAHEASITAMDLYPILAHRMAEGRWQSGVKLKRERPDYLAAVREEVAEQGPLSVKQLSDPGERRGPWWGYSNGKLALEWLYVTGRLAIHHRDRTFTTHYDLPERVVPGELLGGPHADEPAANLDMLRRAARGLGIATERDLADYFRLRMPVARPLIAELVNGGKLEPVEVPGWDEPTYLTPGAASPRRIEAATFLSPFDPIVWFRPRAERVFGFRYRIEIYVPEPDRVYGYYVLPFLLGDQLVGRCDLKADRGTGTLLVQGSYAEADADPDRTTAAMAPALWQLARWLDLDSVVAKPRGDLAGRLATALRATG